MKKKVIAIIITILVIVGIIVGIVIWNYYKEANQPEGVLKEYMANLNEQNYEKMYELITNNSKEKISKEDFITRNKNIYSGIEMKNLKIEILEINKLDATKTEIKYKTTMQTLAGELGFSNTVSFLKNTEKKYEIEWSSNLIYPTLNNEDKLRIKTTEAKRGSILDRNGKMLAGEGTASSVGIVPGKLSENKQQDLEKIATLLDISVESIENDMSASYVKEDTFVPIKTISKNATELKKQLLEIKGIMITDKTMRVYPYGEVTSHLTGYVQSITAEELESRKEKGYDQNSIIGKVGLEKAWEERLKGQDGYEIYIEDSQGNKKSTILQKQVKNGEDIKTTIDIAIQEKLYNSLGENKGLFVVMQPETGEMLALVSTPSYDANDFAMGYSNNKWNLVKNDERNLLLNRFAQSWTPGSVFKPITGAIGLTNEKFDANEDFGRSGLSWQNNKSWGNYYITTLTPYSQAANLQNALLRSDNIYFAKLALRIGSSTLVEGLNQLGFGEEIPFIIDLAKSQVSNNGKIETEISLADSGYGQGEILVNPIHMACIYSAFINEGNMLKPYIEYKETPDVQYWKTNVFSKDAAAIIQEDLIQVVENSNGTAHDAKINGITLAGKTGTAEIQKNTTEDEGTQLGWFNCFTVNSQNPMLIVSMVEDAKTTGGSHYLISKIKELF